VPHQRIQINHHSQQCFGLPHKPMHEGVMTHGKTFYSITDESVNGRRNQTPSYVIHNGSCTANINPVTSKTDHRIQMREAERSLRRLFICGRRVLCCGCNNVSICSFVKQKKKQVSDTRLLDACWIPIAPVTAGVCVCVYLYVIINTTRDRVESTQTCLC
jgi:hypothetical protein